MKVKDIFYDEKEIKCPDPNSLNSWKIIYKERNLKEPYKKLVQRIIDKLEGIKCDG